MIFIELNNITPAKRGSNGNDELNRKTFYNIIVKQAISGDHRDADYLNQSFNNSILLVDDEAEHTVEILVPGKFS